MRAFASPPGMSPRDDAAAPPRFGPPENCPLPVCSAIAGYEEVLAKHRESEARLRDSMLRESELLRQKDELILQKEMLSSESEHRLLNGLQMISSLLTLQSRATVNPEAATQLTTASRRVAALARVHRHLNSLDNSRSVEFRQYLERLCQDLADLASSGSTPRSLVVEGPALSIPAAIAIPLGFIISELITNAIKHGQGRIAVRLQETPRGCALSICDDGPGLPQGFDPAATKGLGMRLVSALVKQIDGAIDFGRGDLGRGTNVTVRFDLRGAPALRPMPTKRALTSRD